MGKEFPLARKKEEGQSVLLAIASSGEHITASCSGDERTQGSYPPEFCKGRKAKSTKTKSQSSSKAKRANASSSKKERRRRDNKNRKSNRGDEGEDKPVGRSSQELGIVYPGAYCDESETFPHHWVEKERVAKGSLFQCKFCHIHLWLPQGLTDVEMLATLINKHGKDEGYCRFLNRRRAAKILVAKMQDLERLENKITDKVEFARIADKILSDKDYDRKED